MPFPDTRYLHYITDKDRKPYYIKSNGAVDKMPQTPGVFLGLKQHPKGWEGIEISFATNKKYWSLNRAFAAPLTYVNDGAKILRYLRYRGKGYEADAHSLILSWNPSTGVYEEEYFGKIDMLLADDDPPIGMSVTSKEGGLLSYLAANDSVNYELKCDKSNPAAVRVLFDGIELFDKLNFSIIPVDLSQSGLGMSYTSLPMIFTNNEGDSVGIVKGDPSFEPTNNFNPYNQTSSNYLFYSALPIEIKISGTTKFTWSSVNNQSGRIILFYYTSSSTGGVTPTQTFYDQQNLTVNEFTVNWDKVINLAPDERLFIFIGVLAPAGNNVTVLPEESTLSLSFKSMNPPSFAWFIKPLDVWKQLVSKMTEGKFTADSNFFSTHNNLALAGGQSLRKIDNAVLKINLQDFFEDYDCDYCMGLKNDSNVLYIEPKVDLYNDNSVIFNLGKISNLKIQHTDDLVVNTIKFGSQVQDYNERNGKYEFNDSKEWKAPVTAKKAELIKVGKFRRDGYGLEFYRGKLLNKDTTDNKGDNEVWKVNITNELIIDYATDGFIIIVHPKYSRLFAVSEKITLLGVTVEILSVVIQSATVAHVIIDTTLSNNTITNGIISFPYYFPKRGRYSVDNGTLLGVRTDTVFNIEEMTPARQMRQWKPYLDSIFYHLKGEKITFQTNDKNKDLVTITNAETIVEKADITIGSSAFFLPYNGSFDKRLPASFSKTLLLANAGHIKANYNGFDLYFLAIGEMKARPVTKEAPEWTLMLSAKTKVSDLEKLSSESLVALDINKNLLMYSIYNPVHMVYYGKELNPKYHFKDIYDDWLHHRNDQFAVQPHYLQKWQKTETIHFQLITRNVGALELFVYDVFANQIDLIPFTSLADPAVKLPYVKKQAAVNLSTYVEGRYLFVIKSGGVEIFISEWQDVAVNQHDTFLIKYHHSSNKLDAYWQTFKPELRVEAFWQPDGTETTSSQYEDEPGNIELLDGRAFSRMKLHVGFPYGIPDWMERKLSRIWILDNVEIEGTEYVKPADSKMEASQRNGYPMPSYTVDLRYANNNPNLMIEGLNLPGDEGKAAITIDAEAFGQGPGVIEIEMP